MTSAFVGAGVVALVTGTVMPDMREPDNLNLVDANTVASEAVERSKAVGDDRASRSDTRGAAAATPEIPPPDIYVLPLESYTLTSKFGFRKSEAGSKAGTHTGVDLAAPSGTPYYAVASGKVILARANGGFGNCIMIDHGGGVISLYGHSTSLAVKEGDIVEAGQQIGTVGDTGYSFGPHLRFEIHVAGERVDPLDFLKGRSATPPTKTQ